jgi:probable HAF family extracellular repeat protein
MSRNLIFRILMAAMLLCLLAPGSPCQTYTVTDLGTLIGGSAEGHAINQAGQVVGGSGHPHRADTHAVFWNNTGGAIDLGRLTGGDYNAAFAINDVGTVVGVANTARGMYAFSWSSGGGLHDLGVLPGTYSSAAYSINNLGQIAGASGSHAVVWNEASRVIQDLGTIGGEWSEARSINNLTQVAGVSDTANGPRAFLWSKGVMQDLGVLPGDIESRANQVNDHGAVAGASEGSSGIHAFLWTSEGGMRALSSMSGSYSEAFALNNFGQVVGQFESSLGTRACLWSNDTSVVDLNELISGAENVILTGALAINDKAQIVAAGIVDAGISRHQRIVLDNHIHSSPTHVFLLTLQEATTRQNR